MFSAVNAENFHQEFQLKNREYCILVPHESMLFPKSSKCFWHFLLPYVFSNLVALCRNFLMAIPLLASISSLKWKSKFAIL